MISNPLSYPMKYPFSNTVGSGNGGFFSDAAMRMDFTSAEAAARNPVSMSRAGASMRYNAQGLREYTPDNIAGFSENLLGSTWIANRVVVDTASTYIEAANSGSHSVQNPISVVEGQYYTISCEASCLTNDRLLTILLTSTQFGVQEFMNIDTSTGAIIGQGTSVLDPIVTVIGTNKVKVKYTVPAIGTSASSSVLFGFSPLGTTTRNPAYLGNGTSQMMVTKVQVQTGRGISSYVQTPTLSPVYNPRAYESQDYNPATGQARGYQWEPSATNFILQSNNTSLTPWGNLDTVITPNSAIGASGAMDFDLATEGSAGTAYTNQGVTTVIGNQYAFSLDLKRGNHDWVRIQLSDILTAFVNVATGFVGNRSLNGAGTFLYAYSIPLPNGIFRFIFSGLAGATNTICYIISASGDGNAARVSGGQRYQGNVQLELSDPTSYIFTGAAQATRVTDACTGTTPWYNTSEGTYYVNSEINTERLAEIDTVSMNDGSTTNRLVYRLRNATNRTRSIGVNGGTVQFDLTQVTTNTDQFYKSVQSYKQDNFNFSRNGAAILSDVSGVVPTGVNTITIGAGAPIHIKDIAYWNTQKPNDFLQQVTT